MPDENREGKRVCNGFIGVLYGGFRDFRARDESEFLSE